MKQSCKIAVIPSRFTVEIVKKLEAMNKGEGRNIKKKIFKSQVIPELRLFSEICGEGGGLKATWSMLMGLDLLPQIELIKGRGGGHPIYQYKNMLILGFCQM